MKNIKPLFYLFLLGALSSCTNSEFVYNEAASHLFLDEMRQIDDTQKTFADSSRIFNPGPGDSIMLNTSAETTIDNAQRDLQTMKDLKPSDAAKDFHQGVVTYLTKIKAYGTTAKQMVAAGADQKKALYTQLKTQYNELNQMPDQVLDVQKKYFAKVGLKPKQQ